MLQRTYCPQSSQYFTGEVCRPWDGCSKTKTIMYWLFYTRFNIHYLRVSELRGLSRATCLSERSRIWTQAPGSQAGALSPVPWELEQVRLGVGRWLSLGVCDSDSEISCKFEGGAWRNREGLQKLLRAQLLQALKERWGRGKGPIIGQLWTCPRETHGPQLLSDISEHDDRGCRGCGDTRTERTSGSEF